MAGGRIKAASISTQYIYDAARPLIETPDSPDAAFAASRNFSALKEHPPFPFRTAFFPQDEGSMRTAFRGSGIYRPTVKTDQGPAGNVGYFTMDGKISSKLNGVIQREQGVAVMEAFVSLGILDARLENDSSIIEQIAKVKYYYERGDYRQTHEAVMKIREICERHGIETTRRGVIGRQEFFFFRPIETERPVVVGSDLIQAISKKTGELVAKIESKAAIARSLVSEGMSIEEALADANEFRDKLFYTGTETKAFLYFQPDVLIRTNGTFDIERINMPDLGIFLTHPFINAPTKNGSLAAIKGINQQIGNEVLDVVVNAMGGRVILLTRDEVLLNREDTLENLEIDMIGDGLRSRGKQVDHSVLSRVSQLVNGSSLLMLNVSTEAPGYDTLLYRVARGEIHCYPDPFVKLFETEATTFNRRIIDPSVIDKFLNIIVPSALDKPEGILNKYRTIQSALKRGGIDSDIVYFSVGNDHTYIPTFRYDVKSFFEVHKAVQAAKRQGKKNELTAVSIPFKPEDAVLYGKDGPRLSVFRFMFVRK